MSLGQKKLINWGLAAQGLESRVQGFLCGQGATGGRCCVAECSGVQPLRVVGRTG